METGVSGKLGAIFSGKFVRLDIRGLASTVLPTSRHFRGELAATRQGVTPGYSLSLSEYLFSLIIILPAAFQLGFRHINF